MPNFTRREFLQANAGAMFVCALPVSEGPTPLAVLPKGTPAYYREAKPLLQLQQEFVDLRFGMFNHFNLATFQDREWGDPHDPPTVFAPTALDTDQWARA